ncbi:MAG: alpha-N-acetylglucosaminidase, partial [Bacteroidales bacterium]|nr:alpha-N-acetylglucosaminidase [Bacteroidales bacterium]
NYCTFGYTMPWWTWKQWERFIDWMALNGVNMPLAITGQEAVWQKVWRKYGLSDEQIRSFFTGPAHLPWQRMNNIDRWQGPLPQNWIDGQAKLQKRILRRERKLNMKPVLPAFSGHVPAELAEQLPDPIDTSRVRSWCKFDGKYRCTFLSSEDPIYAQIQKDFLQEQTRMYGTDHIYGVDLFNEVSPPSWEPEYLAKISSGVYESMAAVDPDAVWMQMGWLFISARRKWTPERIEAYLTAVPQGKMILLDYEGDYVEIWRRTESFYGQKFIWCYLGNFGGMTEIEGDYHHNARLISDSRAEGGPGFVGIGSTLEGFGVNETVYEAVLAQAWSDWSTVDEYLDNIADRHLGREDSNFRAYWHQMADKVCITHTSTSSSSIICVQPCLEGRGNWTTEIKRGYDIADMETALSLIEKVEGASDYFGFDLANARRQALSNKALAVRDSFTAAYKAGDRAGMASSAEEFLGICDSLISVLRTRPEFSLADWIRDARGWGKTAEEKDYYEMNARSIISIWGDSPYLCDYANREWDDMVESYYKVRWSRFFDAVMAAFDAGEPFDQERFDQDMWNFNCQWAHSL